MLTTHTSRCVEVDSGVGVVALCIGVVCGCPWLFVPGRVDNRRNVRVAVAVVPEAEVLLRVVRGCRADGVCA